MQLIMWEDIIGDQAHVWPDVSGNNDINIKPLLVSNQASTRRYSS